MQIYPLDVWFNEVETKEFFEFEAISTSDDVKMCFEGIRDSFNQSCVGKLVQRCVPFSELIADICNCISGITNTKIFNVLVDYFQSSSASIESGKFYEFILSVFRAAKVCAVAVFPFALYKIGLDCWEIVSSVEKLDAIFRVSECLSWLGYSASIFIDGLHVVGAFVDKAVSLEFGFTLAGVILSIATILLNAKHLVQGEELLEYVDTLGDRAVINTFNVRSDYELERYFGMEGAKLRVVIESDNAVRAVAALKERIVTRNLSHKLAITSATITVVGMAILLFTPFFPIGHGLLVVAAIISIVKFAFEYQAAQRLESELIELQ